MDFKCWISIVFVSIFFLMNVCDAKMCWDSSKTKDWFCCDNHEEVNETCVACRIGYLSNFGEQCTECQEGFYGLKCIGICSCRNTESCNHVAGCIEKTESNILVRKEFTTENKQLPQVSPSLVPDTSAKEDKFLGLSNREIVVYSTGIGGLTLLLLLLLGICRHNLKNRHQSFVLEGNITQNNFPESAVSTDNIEGPYETIDESNMIDAPLDVTIQVTVKNTSSEESTDSEHSHSLLNNDYLNPYQPMVPDTQKHVYNFPTNFYPDDSESSGSTETNSEYLNPYQQIVPDSEPHNYISIKVECYTRDSSTSDKNEKEKEYEKKKYFEMEMEDVEETINTVGTELQNLHSYQIECSSANYEMTVDSKNSLSIDVISLDEVLCDEATNNEQNENIKYNIL